MAPRERAYLPGETVQGSVRIQSEGPVACGGVAVLIQAVFSRVKPVWTAQEVGVVAGQRLVGEPTTVQPGQEFPFALELPKRFFDYQGTLFTVSFILEAEAKIPQMVRAQTRIPVGRRQETALHAMARPENLVTDHGTLRSGVIGALAGVAIAAAGFVFVSPFWLVSGFLVLAFGLYMVLSNVKPWLAERRTGALEVKVDGSSPQALDISLEGRGSLPFESAQAELVIREFARVSGGENRKTWVQPLYAGRVELQPMGEGRYAVRMPLPAAGRFPYSVKLASEVDGDGLKAVGPTGGGHSYAVDWTLHIDAKVANWPDWSRQVQLWVRPADMPFD